MSVSELVTANNQFSFDLLAQLNRGEPAQNLFYSPASLLPALSMTGNGADEETARGLRQALRLKSLSWEKVNEAQAALWQDLTEKKNEALHLAAANSVWAEQGFPFAEAFRRTVLAHYEAKIANLDFDDPAAAAEQINHWVAQQTAQKITNLLRPAALMDTVLVLVNAIYFKGKWTDPFAEARTKPGDFHLPDGRKKQFPMMQRRGQYHYAEYAQWQMISLPFADGQFAMVIVMPQRGVTLPQLLSSLNVETWTHWMTRLLPPQTFGEWNPRLLSRGRQPGTIVLPRFKLAARLELLPVLQKMGLRSNRFDRMSAAGRPLQIDKVIHQAVLEVNEQGAEAAAATAVTMVRTAVIPQEPFRMVVNRPFFCAVQDCKTGMVLFAGVVYEPEML